MSVFGDYLIMREFESKLALSIQIHSREIFCCSRCGSVFITHDCHAMPKALA